MLDTTDVQRSLKGAWRLMTGRPDGMRMLEAEQMLPAVGQGALAIEARTGDERVVTLARRVHDLETCVCVAAERGVMVAVEGDCRTPMGAHARIEDGDRLRLRAFVAEPDGSRYRAGEADLAWPAQEEQARELGLRLGRELA